MDISKTRLASMVVGSVWMLTAGSPVMADDTELFVATSTGSGIRPNVLFIIDNSGSMGTIVHTQEPYDPSRTYTGSCGSDRVYWRTGTGSAPTCTTTRWFNMSALKCDAAVQAFTRGGQYIDKLVQYDPDSVTTGPSSRRDTGERWELLDENFRDRAVECQADAGAHGSSSGDANRYTRDGATSNGYWGGSTTQISWRDAHNNQSYTLYSGNYLNWVATPTVDQTRLEIVQDVATSLINSINGVNIGLMYFNQPVDTTVGSQGGVVGHAMENISVARGTINTEINNLDPETYTPLSETLYEASQYYRGDRIVFGTNSVNAARANANTYASPITDTCQQNYVVLLTDGEPTFDSAADSAIRGLTDRSGRTFSSLVGATCDTETYPAGFNPSGGTCLDDLAEFMYEGDSSTLPGTQTVKTYTIGFTVDLPVLAQTAQRGGGVYYTADDTATLANALTNILVDILDTDQTFASPTVSVNAFNRTQNLSDLFISVFRPTGQRHWRINGRRTASTWWGQRPPSSCCRRRPLAPAGATPWS